MAQPSTEPRNKPQEEVHVLVQKAQGIYGHFNVPAPTPRALRAAMISRVCKYTPTKVDVANNVTSDGTTSGIGSNSIDYTKSAQLHPGYAEKIENLNELNKQKRLASDDHRNATTKSCRDYRRRSATYQKIDDMNTAMAAGGKYMSDATLDSAVDFVCSVVLWPQLGGRTIDEAMRLPNFSQYTGITQQRRLSLEALNFLIVGVGKRKNLVENSTMVPPITHPSGSYINVPDAEAMGFFYFAVFRSVSMFDCKRFEEKMQNRYAHLPYITKILFKRAGNGANYTKKYSKKSCVYFTGIFGIQDLLDNGTIIKGDAETSRAFYGV